ncbi:trigger factor [Thioalkalivibrio sp. K90mix]|uniref:trigger factor n=1 Tax=unclassified Thioalkalivibrio TaxID=2621013 RepID=UPI000195A636|nr:MULTISPECIES: trigger factor [unclassified Thioalkalivibrio]ADC71087.1 trigger factor [Thioalkalivibrio sp. K90mix]
MQVSVEATGNLERKMTIQVPPERVETEVDNRLKSLAKRVRLDGFRPGKVPLKVVRQRYGAGVYQEVLSEVLQESYREAVQQEGLEPAGNPSIEPQSVESGQPIEFVASFQVFPEVEVADFSDAKIERPVAEIGDEDIDRVIDSLREQNKEWADVKRKAKKGDRITLDFVGSIDGEEFEGGKADDFQVEVGAGRLIEDFEKQLKGVKTGEEPTIDVTFPDDYPAENLKGKTAQFALTIKKVEGPKLPEVDEEFAKKFGIEDGSVEKLRADVRSNMERELNQALKGKVKNQVMELIIERHGFDLPDALVKSEINRLREEAEKRFGGAQQTQPLPDSLFEEEAKRRVRLGLALRAIIDQKGFEVDAERVERDLEDMAATYEDPEEVKQYYRSNPQAKSNLESLVLEDQVVDWIVDQAKVTEKKTSFQDVMNPNKESTE